MSTSKPRTAPQPPRQGFSDTIDPTANVIALVEAANLRADDLREASNRFNEAQIANVANIVNIQVAHVKEMRGLDSDRLEKIRQVDILNAQASAQQLLTAVQTLAASTTQSAETLRAAVANTAVTIQTQTDRVVAGMTERITNLEKTSYTGQGKQSSDDPRLLELMTEMRGVVNRQQASAGQEKGSDKTWAFVVGAIGLAMSVAVFFGNRPPASSAQQSAPAINPVPLGYYLAPIPSAPAPK